MPPETEPASIPARVKRAWTAGIVAGLVGLVTVAIVTEASDNPRSVVSDYFAAILDGDIDTALSLVGSHALDDASRYLDAGAVGDDWQVVSIEDRGEGEYESDRVVGVKLGGPAGVAEGELLLTESEATGWRIASRPKTVHIAPSPLEYVQVNGYTPQPQATDRDTNTMALGHVVELLPGFYTFYEDIPGVVEVAGSKTYAALPSDATEYDRDIDMLAVGKVVAGRKTIASARKQLKERLDECVEATVPRPGDCPFGAGDFVNTPDGEHVEELSGLTWTLERMPRFKMVDARFQDPDSVPVDTGGWQFMFVADDADVLTLRGKGVDSDGKKIDFEAPCRVDLAAVSATVDRTGRVNLSSTAMPDYRDGPMSCGKEV